MGAKVPPYAETQGTWKLSTLFLFFMDFMITHFIYLFVEFRLSFTTYVIIAATIVTQVVSVIHTNYSGCHRILHRAE